MGSSLGIALVTAVSSLEFHAFRRSAGACYVALPYRELLLFSVPEPDQGLECLWCSPAAIWGRRQDCRSVEIRGPESCLPRPLL